MKILPSKSPCRSPSCSRRRTEFPLVAQEEEKEEEEEEEEEKEVAHYEENRESVIS